MSRGGVENGSEAEAPGGEPDGGVLGYAKESLRLSEPIEDSVERSEGEEEGYIDARLSVTQSDDPLSGGHFAEGMSKAPLDMVKDGMRERRAWNHSPRTRQRT